MPSRRAPPAAAHASPGLNRLTPTRRARPGCTFSAGCDPRAAVRKRKASCRAAVGSAVEAEGVGPSGAAAATSPLVAASPRARVAPPRLWSTSGPAYRLPQLGAVYGRRGPSPPPPPAGGAERGPRRATHRSSSSAPAIAVWPRRGGRRRRGGSGEAGVSAPRRALRNLPRHSCTHRSAPKPGARGRSAWLQGSSPPGTAPAARSSTPVAGTATRPARSSCASGATVAAGPGRSAPPRRPGGGGCSCRGACCHDMCRRAARTAAASAARRGVRQACRAAPPPGRPRAAGGRREGAGTRQAHTLQPRRRRREPAWRPVVPTSKPS